MSLVALAEVMADFIREDMEKNKGVLVRPLCMFDEDETVRLRVAGWLFSEWETEIRQSPGGLNSVEELAANLLEPKDDVTLVAVDVDDISQGEDPDSMGRRIVATGRLSVKDLASHDARCTPWLAAVYVPEESRKKGYGRLIVKAVMDCARRRGEAFLHLWFPVSKELVLRPLYESLGFEEFERTVVSNSSFGEEIVVMRWRVDLRKFFTFFSVGRVSYGSILLVKLSALHS